MPMNGPRRRLKPSIRSLHASERLLAESYAIALTEADGPTCDGLEQRFRSGDSAGFPDLCGTFMAIFRACGAPTPSREQQIQHIRDYDIEHPDSWTAPDAAPYSVWDNTFRQRRIVIERELEAGLEGPLFDNCRMLAETLELSSDEQEVLAFLALVTNHQPLGNILGDVVGRTSVPEVLELLFDLDEVDAAGLVCETGQLMASGLISNAEENIFHPQLPRLAPSLAKSLLRKHADAEALVKSLLTPAPAAELTMDDFRHLGRTERVLSAFVRGALSSDVRGVNILIHGAPGTGKTQLARALAAAAGASLFEVPFRPRGSYKPLSGSQRLAELRLCQRLVAKLERCAVLFDEAEDLFPANHFGGASQLALPTRTAPKGFVNDALESTPTVTFWTSNGLGQIDPAHRRRIDFVLRLDLPPVETRRRIIDARLGEYDLQEQTLAALSHETLTPAEIERLGRVISLSDGVDAELALEVARDAGELTRRPRRSMKEGPKYDPSLCAVDHDLASLTAGLERRGSGRVLLHGPPGTGKTAWVHHLAERLGRRLVVAAGSSLFSKWVGDTEKNIASIFARASREEAVLFMDEADTFLTSRENGKIQNHWEQQSTNELLQEMERFDGIFVCATNLFHQLDPASLRRFDLKLHFDAPGAETRLALFRATLTSLGVDDVDDEIIRSLETLEGLTPGDFANAARRASFLEAPPDAAWLHDVLADELATRRQHSGRSLGFGH